MKREIKFKIGCSGFFNHHWKKLFYPESLPQSQWFRYYCEHFETLEINTTFYKFPSAESLRKWFVQSPKDFVFAVKAPRIITHFKKFIDCSQLLNDFYLACSNGLQNKLAYTLFQFPPQVKFSEEKFELILCGINPAFKNAIEFRHESWWNEFVYSELRKRNISFCTVSHPSMPDTVIATTSSAYVRLHGVPQMFYSDYSFNTLATLRDSILKLSKINEAFVFFNNTAGDAGILNAQLFRKMV